MNSNNHKYGAVQIFCNPSNLTLSLNRTDSHTLRFPSKFEASVYIALRKYLDRLNKSQCCNRYSLECQFKIELLGKTGVMKSPITHVVDFVIRDSQSAVNPVLYVEAKGSFLPEYIAKMKLLEGFKEPIHKRYLVVSKNRPPSGYTAHHTPFNKIESALYYLGIK